MKQPATRAVEKRDACCPVPNSGALALRLYLKVCGARSKQAHWPTSSLRATPAPRRRWGTGLQARTGGPGPGCCPAGAGGGRSRAGRSAGPRAAGRLDSAVRTKLTAVLCPPLTFPPQPAAWPRSCSLSGPSRAAAPPAMATEASCAASGSASSHGSEVPWAGRGGVRRGRGWSGWFEKRSFKKRNRGCESKR